MNQIYKINAHLETHTRIVHSVPGQPVEECKEKESWIHKK